MAVEGWLVALTGSRAGAQWALPMFRGERCDIGRIHDARVRLDDETVGRRHATIIAREHHHDFHFNGAGGGAALNDVDCEMTYLPLTDGDELRLGRVRLRYVTSQEAADAAVAELVQVEPITRLSRSVPPGAARLRIADLDRIAAHAGWIVADQLCREVAARLVTLATGDATIAYVAPGVFAVTPADAAARLAVEASFEPIEVEGERIVVELEPDA